MNGEHIAYIGLGSNLADREANLARAVELLGGLDGCRVTARSGFASYQAEGARPGAPDYLNGAISVATSLSPFALRRQLAAIERQMGRPDVQDRLPNADRLVDLDLLLYDQALIVSSELVVPHPRMHNRRFVLEPLAAIAPDLVHPVLGRTAKELLTRLNNRAAVG